MRNYMRRISPKGAFGDFLDHWRAPTPRRWWIMAISVALTGSMLAILIPPSVRAPPEKPEVTWITTFADGRTRAQIIASNCANEALQQQIEAAIAAQEEQRREMFKALGRATFVDVEAMEREIEAERAAEAAASPVDEPTEEELALSLAEYCARAGG
jgi:hypothetical protein